MSQERKFLLHVEGFFCILSIHDKDHIFQRKKQPTYHLRIDPLKIGCWEHWRFKLSANHGQWQAQGDDIKEKQHGHCLPWGEDEVPTKEQGYEWLEEVMDMCTKSQRRRREKRALKDAKRFIKRSPPEGCPKIMKSFPARDDSFTNARIDLEIWGGLAFRDPGEDDE